MRTPRHRAGKGFQPAAGSGVHSHTCGTCRVPSTALSRSHMSASSPRTPATWRTSQRQSCPLPSEEHHPEGLSHPAFLFRPAQWTSSLRAASFTMWYPRAATLLASPCSGKRTSSWAPTASTAYTPRSTVRGQQGRGASGAAPHLPHGPCRLGWGTASQPLTCGPHRTDDSVPKLDEGWEGWSLAHLSLSQEALQFLQVTQ